MEITQQSKELLQGNKYFKWYWNIIEKAKNRNTIKIKNDGNETHHIIPKSKYFGGLNNKENLVVLTYKEHYIVHLVLWKGLREKFGTKNNMTRAMALGFVRMSHINNLSKKHKISSANEFTYFKQAYSEASKDRVMSNEVKQRMIVGLTGQKRTEEQKKKISLATIGRIFSDEHRLNLSKSGKGKHSMRHSEETKRIIKEKRKLQIFSYETRQKMKDAWLRRKQVALK